MADARQATPASLLFAETEASLASALSSRAGAILTTPELASGCSDPRVLPTGNPRLAFAQLALELAPPRVASIHPTAVVEPDAVLGQGVQIGAGAYVGSQAVLGDAVTLGPGARVLDGVQVGNGCVVQAGAVLGSTGFGFVRDPESGAYTLFPQQGALVLEDRVEVGANTTIDRGALGETRIGAGTKIDNLVHVGHNVRIGRNVVIAAQVGISGSCVIEDGAVLAGQVGISDHCHIGPGVILGGQAGVFRGASVDGPGQLFAGTPAEPIKNFLKSLAKLRRLK